MGLRLFAVAALFCWAAGALVEHSPPSRFVHDNVRIPGYSGRTTLAISIGRPRGDGPYRAVVLNHGVPLTERAPLGVTGHAAAYSGGIRSAAMPF